MATQVGPFWALLVLVRMESKQEPQCRFKGIDIDMDIFLFYRFFLVKFSLKINHSMRNLEQEEI